MKNLATFSQFTLVEEEEPTPTPTPSATPTPTPTPLPSDRWTTDIPLSAVHASFLGEEENDSSGYSIAGVGDVNGDGYEDLLIGAPNSAAGGTGAGQTYLVLGKASGWVNDVSLMAVDASFIGENVHDESGNSVRIIDDVNGDGYDDILIGAPDYSEGESKQGKTYLFFGKEEGWAMDTDLSTADASFVGGLEEYSGYAVAGAGDVNGDGYGDLLIGAPGIIEDSDRGRAYLVLGKDSGWATNVNLSTANGSFEGEIDGDTAGGVVAGVGDVNGDGYDDILIGDPYNNEGETLAGKVYLVMGKASGWALGTNLSTADASYVGETLFGMFGISAMGAGDVNKDGYDDILIGESGQPKGGDAPGKTYLVLGKASGWTTNVSPSSVDASFVGEENSDMAGISVACAGDVNGDGYDDLFIGAPFNSEGAFMAGKTYVVMGRAGGWTIGTSLADADASFIGEFEGDNAGGSVANAGDVNGDGYDDILIGAYGNGEGVEEAGQTYLMLSNYYTATGTYLRVLPAGDVTEEDFGTTRTKIDFNDGSAGVTNVTLYRTSSGSLAQYGMAGYWEINTTKTGFTADVTFHYVNSEISGVDEGSLKLYTRESAADPWELVEGQTLNTTNNTLKATGLTHFSYFTLATQLPPSVGGLSVSVKEDDVVVSDSTESAGTSAWVWPIAVILLATVAGAAGVWFRSVTRRQVRQGRG
jgi:hypothetical protein